jgi:hypothetical protein
MSEYPGRHVQIPSDKESQLPPEFCLYIMVESHVKQSVAADPEQLKQKLWQV